jgi:hypothetical protein
MKEVISIDISIFEFISSPFMSMTLTLKIWIFLYFRFHLKGKLISFLPTFLEVFLSHCVWSNFNDSNLESIPWRLCGVNFLLCRVIPFQEGRNYFVIPKWVSSAKGNCVFVDAYEFTIKLKWIVIDSLPIINIEDKTHKVCCFHHLIHLFSLCI